MLQSHDMYMMHIDRTNSNIPFSPNNNDFNIMETLTLFCNYKHIWN